jgi:hypothetical protein
MKRLILAALGYWAYRSWRKNRDMQPDQADRNTRFADAEKGESGF